MSFVTTMTLAGARARHRRQAQAPHAPDSLPIPLRSQLAQARLPQARAALANCHLCSHHCGVNRLEGERGVCLAGPTGRVFTAQIEVGDELELVPTFAIALSGCDLRCSFCITRTQSWNPRAGGSYSPDEIAARAKTALAHGARTVMFLGGEPTIHLPTVLAIVAALPEDTRLIWKTNACASTEARALLAGLFDVWLPDYKFGNDRCAEQFARVSNYTHIVRENLRWARPQGELIVRHLLLPGHVDCCWRPIAQWLATELPGVKVSLRTEFWPTRPTALHPELIRLVTDTERKRALDIAADCGLRCIP